MGKLLHPPEKAGGALNKQQNDNKTSSNCERSSITNHSGNILIYLILFVSLSFSAYTFLRQTHYENRIQYLQTLDQRISVLEDKLRIFPLAFLNSLAKSTTMSTTTTTTTPTSPEDRAKDSTVAEIDLITDDASNDEQFAHILQKLSLEVSGIRRLRRDVSHLKASRRGERQASVHPADCSCPPGNNNSMYCLTVVLLCTDVLLYTSRSTLTVYTVQYIEHRENAKVEIHNSIKSTSNE